MAQPSSQLLADQARRDIGGIKSIHSVLQHPQPSLSRTCSSPQTETWYPPSNDSHFPFPPAPVTSDPHSVFMNSPLLGISYEASGNIYLWGWLISFSIMFLRLAHIVPCIRIPSLVRLSNFPFYNNYILCNPSSH